MLRKGRCELRLGWLSHARRCADFEALPPLLSFKASADEREQSGKQLNRLRSCAAVLSGQAAVDFQRCGSIVMTSKEIFIVMILHEIWHPTPGSVHVHTGLVF